MCCAVKGNDGKWINKFVEISRFKVIRRVFEGLRISEVILSIIRFYQIVP